MKPLPTDAFILKERHIIDERLPLALDLWRIARHHDFWRIMERLRRNP